MQESVVTNPPSNATAVKGEKGNLVTTKLSLFKPQEYEIPRLSLLNDMATLIEQWKILPDLSNTIFIGVQHILETTVTLFDKLKAIGVKYENMYFSGKCYSTAPEIEAQVRKRGIKLMESNQPEEPGEYEKYCRKGIVKMWETCIEEISQKQVDRIIILDEGGRCLESMPEFIAFRYNVAAIEQTRAKLYSEAINLLPFPLVEVASCAVKKFLELPLIAEAVLNRTKSLLRKLNPDKNTVFGIVGNGAIGYAICRYLLSQGYTVIVYDQSESAFQNIIDKKFYRLSRIEAIIAGANIIFGCTEKDITEGIDILSIIKKDKIFISCTSEDKEFRSLLRAMASQNIVSIDTLSDLVCLSRNRSKIVILQGGFPFNFDRKPWNVPAQDIEVTQGLLFGACIQAIMCATKPIEDGTTVNYGSRQALDPFMQRYVALHWLLRQNEEKYAHKLKEIFEDIQWIRKNSGGDYQDNPQLGLCFNSEQAQRYIFTHGKARL